jgi:hypothetical protein
LTAGPLSRFANLSTDTRHTKGGLPFMAIEGIRMTDWKWNKAGRKYFGGTLRIWIQRPTSTKRIFAEVGISFH